MITLARTEDEINEQVNQAMAGENEGSRWPGMSYEQGVDAALRWAVGWTDDVPMAGD